MQENQSDNHMNKEVTPVGSDYDEIKSRYYDEIGVPLQIKRPTVNIERKDRRREFPSERQPSKPIPIKSGSPQSPQGFIPPHIYKHLHPTSSTPNSPSSFDTRQP